MLLLFVLFGLWFSLCAACVWVDCCVSGVCFGVCYCSVVCFDCCVGCFLFQTCFFFGGFGVTLQYCFVLLLFVVYVLIYSVSLCCVVVYVSLLALRLIVGVLLVAFWLFVACLLLLVFSLVCLRCVCCWICCVLFPSWCLFGCFA